MKQNYKQIKRCLATLALVLCASSVWAIERPSIGRTLTDGQTYTLVSFTNPSNFLSRTSWDGAYYLLDINSSNYAKNVFTAHKNEWGEWYFSVAVNDSVTNYVGIPASTDNLNANLESPAYFIVTETDTAGFYRLKAGEGQGNYACVGRYLHLNSGNQYLVISEPYNSWYPDFYGGVKTEIDEDGNEVRVTDDNGEYIPLSHESELWAFADTTDIPTYNLKVQVYSAVKDIENNYLSDETYQQGWQSAISAVETIYANDPFTQENSDACFAIIDAKKALYKEIQTAQTILGDESDATLEAAIATAQQTFNESSDANVLNQAVSDLQEAEKNHQLGLGDVTALGTNMSFEDLSAQGGSMTTGVAAPPTGWNLYVNGTQVTTAEEAKAAGLTGWAGVNDDADNKDENYVYGIWNSGMPETEISQTISGLENGTYVVSASMMVGANGNGSRRTTQRIFGNLNSKYFASSSEYDESRLDRSEVIEYEGLTEPVTDRELQPMSVRAFVYDGTLTFGFRTNGDIKAANRTNANSAGGDGWFKLDNFRIQKEGYIVDDALAVADYYTNLLVDLIYGNKLQNSIYEETEKLVNKYNLSTSSSQEEIIQAIQELKAAYPTVKNSIDAYQKLADAIDQGNEYAEEYGNYAGIEAYNDVLLEATDMYEFAEANEEEIANMIQQLDEALQTLKLSGVATGVYVTSLMKNPGFEDLSAQGGTELSGVAAAPAGWTLTIDGVEGTPTSGWCAINSGDDISSQGITDDEGNLITVQYVEGTHLWGIWNDKVPEVELSQTLTNLPAGTYILSANVMVEYNWAGNCLTTQRIFANDYVQMFGTENAHTNNLPADAVAAKEFDEANTADLKKLTYAGYTCTSDDPLTHTLRPMSVTFGVGEDGIAKVGFRTNNIDENGEARTSGIGWFKLDNFQLYYESETIPTDIKGVSGKAQKFVGVSYFTTDGVQINQPQKGVNIVRYLLEDGTVKTQKVVIK